MNNEDGLLEELLALRRIEEAWDNNSPPLSSEINGFFSSTSSWGFDVLDSTPQPPPPPQTTSILPNFPDQFYSSSSSCFPMLEDACHVMTATCKPEPAISGEIPATSPSSLFTTESKSSSGKKKVGGQPSKNLMAERRRRKRLNDRLSMLRSVVPKISKMDRTSILGDTIEYMKELLERINSLQDEIEEVGSNQLNAMSIFKDNNDKPNDVLVRNSPKFDVERKNMDTRVEICCGGKPGLLLSTVTTLEALGLEIQQCVISCFNDFSLQASCSEEMDQRKLISSEEIKQELFRNAGYGGRCL